MQKEILMGHEKNKQDKARGEKLKIRDQHKTDKWTYDAVIDSLYAFRHCHIGYSCHTATELINKWRASKQKQGILTPLILFEKHREEMFEYAIHLMKKKVLPPKNRSKFFNDPGGRPYKIRDGNKD